VSIKVSEWLEKCQDLVSVRSSLSVKAQDTACWFLSAVMSVAVCNDRLFRGRLE